MGKQNTDAQYNEECSYSLEHQRLLRNRSNKAPTFCTVKEIPLSVVNFSGHDDFEQHCVPRSAPVGDAAQYSRSLLPSTSGCERGASMSYDTDDRTARYRNELAQCDRDDRAAENGEMCAPALILVSAAVAVASFTAHQTIGLTPGIVGVIAGFVWRSDLKARSIARTERRLSLWRALIALTKATKAASDDS
jgi:hypothetical protein